MECRQFPRQNIRENQSVNWFVAGTVQRSVIDKTNAQGLFDFRIRFGPNAISAFPERVGTVKNREPGKLRFKTSTNILPTLLADSKALKVLGKMGRIFERETPRRD